MQICEAFGANRYPFPEEPARQRQMNAEVTARLRELHTTIEAGQPMPLFCIPKPSPQYRKAFFQPQTSLSLDFQYRVDVSELTYLDVLGLRRAFCNFTIKFLLAASLHTLTC